MKNLIYLVAVFGLLLVIGAPMNQMQAASDPETTSALGTWICWDDGTFDPCHNSLYSVSLATLTDGWAVGANGTLLHWNGSTWSIHPSSTPNSLEVVQMYSADDGWAAGIGGVILHWDGINWSSVISPTTSTIRDISIVNSSNAWAAGSRIYQWDGVNWNTATVSVTTFAGISMTPGTNGTDGWAVGSGGKIVRWNGSEWLSFTSPTSEYLYDVEMISPTDGWIVGNKGTFLHWNGTEWSPAPTMASDISTIFEVKAASSNNVWATGFDNGGYYIYHWSGITWDPQESNYDNTIYSGLGVTPGSNGEDAWVVGGSGYMARWNGSDWLPINEPYGKALYDVQMLSRSNGWAAGSAWPVAYGDALHWDGAFWSPEASVSAYGIDFYSDSTGTTGWAVGVWGVIKHWGGSYWSSVTSPVDVDLAAVDMLSHDEAWAVGGGRDLSSGEEYAVVVHYVNGNWETVPLASTEFSLYDLAILSPTNGWAVGESGIILKWDGGTWQPFPSPAAVNLLAIAMLDASNGWIVGAYGTILHWDGSTWTSYSSPFGAGMTDVVFVSPTNGWAVGDVGAILHYDGISWTQLLSPTQTTLMAITDASEYELWAVGFGGVILHYDVTPTLAINYPDGAPGSFFTLTGSNFPANDMADITINGQDIGDVPTDALGGFNFILSTSLADEGIYYITANVNPSDTARLVLDANADLRIKDGTYTIFQVPDGIAIGVTILPIIVK